MGAKTPLLWGQQNTLAAVSSFLHLAPAEADAFDLLHSQQAPQCILIGSCSALPSCPSRADGTLELLLLLRRLFLIQPLLQSLILLQQPFPASTCWG